MNRPRSPGRRDLPPWFRVIRKGGHTSYALEHPITREWATLSKDRDEALALYWQLAPEIRAQVEAKRMGRRAVNVAAVMDQTRPRSGETLSKYLERWRTKILPTLTKRRSGKPIGEKTRGDYDRMCRLQIEPLADAGIPLASVDAQALRAILKPWLTMPHQYNYMRAVLSRALQHAVDEGLLAANPVKTVEGRAAPKRDVYVLDEHYVAITAKLPEYLSKACDILYLLSARPGDCLALRHDQVIEVDGKPCVAFTAGKTGEDQELISNTALAEVLDWWRAWRKQHAPLSPFLLVHPMTASRQHRGNPIDRDWLSRRFKAAAIAAGLPQYHLADLRPKGITDEHLAGNTGNKGGHKTEAMKRHYQRVRLPTRANVMIELPKRAAR